MGSLFAPKVQAAPPPPEPKDYNVDDRISGMTSRIVNNPDGTKTQIIEKNLTPEQQEIENNLKRISEENLAKYEQLVNDPFLESMPEFKSQIDTIFQNRQQQLDKSFTDAASMAEKNLARFGVEDSTAAATQRQLGQRAYMDATTQLNDEKFGLTQAFRAQEMGNRMNAYGLASGRQDTLLANSLNTFSLANQSAFANAARNDAYNNQVFQNNLMNTQARNQAAAQGAGTLGYLAGVGIGGYFGGGFGKTGGSGTSVYPSSGRTIKWY